LLILFSSSSLALAFLKSAINCTNPRIFALFPMLPRPKNPAAAEDAMIEIGCCPPGKAQPVSYAVDQSLAQLK
jgi:hypothetical protein